MYVYMKRILGDNLNVFFFSAMEYSILYFFLNILNIVVQLQVPVLMLYIIITRLGDYVLNPLLDKINYSIINCRYERLIIFVIYFLHLL